MRDTSLLLALLLLPLQISAAENPVAAKPILITLTTNNSTTITSSLVKYPLQDVRGALTKFSTLSGTNLYGSMASLGIVDRMDGEGGQRAVSLSICSCNTPSPCYQIVGIRVGEDKTRLEVRSPLSADASVHKYEARRDPKILEDLHRLLNEGTTPASLPARSNPSAPKQDGVAEP